MVSAGMKKKRVQYAMEKKDWRVAWFIKKTSDPWIQVKKPLNPRKTTIKM